MTKIERILNKQNFKNVKQLMGYDVREAELPTYEISFLLNSDFPSLMTICVELKSTVFSLLPHLGSLNITAPYSITNNRV